LSNIGLSNIGLQGNWTRLMIAVLTGAALLGLAIALAALYFREM
jgi:hypothetical protein